MANKKAANKKADFKLNDMEEIKKQINVKNCWFDDREGLFHCLMKNGSEWTSSTGSAQEEWKRIPKTEKEAQSASTSETAIELREQYQREHFDEALTYAKSEKEDIIKKPNHYCAGRKYEPKDVIRDWDLNFNLGNAVKYISRNGRKAGNSALQDLKKARQYLDFEIEFLESKEE